MKLNDHLFFYPENGILDCNTYIIKDQKAMIVDVGLDKYLPLKVNAMEKDGINPHKIDIIANTHLHMDHAWSNEDFKNKYGSKIEIAPVQKQFYDVSVRQTSQFFGMDPVDFQEDGLLPTPINLGTIEIEVIPTPGHSPDSVCFYCGQIKALLCGDLIFEQNTGRPDLPGGDWEQLKQSVEDVSKLDIDLILPGHMNIISGKKNVKKNFDFLMNNIF